MKLRGSALVIRLRRSLTPEDRVVPFGAARLLFFGAAVLAVIGTVTFAVTTAEVREDADPAALDRGVAEWFDGHRSPGLTIVAMVLATIFGPVMMPAVVLVTSAVWAARARQLWRPGLLAGAMLFGVVLVQILTRLIGRHRPPLASMLMGPDGTASYPSGHVTAAADFTFVGGFLLLSRAFRLLGALLMTLGSLALVAAESVARMYLGYHWLTDCVASAALSLVVLGAAIAVDTWRFRQRLPGP
jgi:undecaprenyl-diphosphatase